jgi:hypothetical protein
MPTYPWTISSQVKSVWYSSSFLGFFYALKARIGIQLGPHFCGLFTLSEHLVFAFIERTEAEISHPDAIMALLREPPIFPVELLVENERVAPYEDQGWVDAPVPIAGFEQYGPSLDHWLSSAAQTPHPSPPV